MNIDEKIGKEYWFEYHCYESEKSCDSEIWYRSHQKVLVLSISAFGGGDTQKERAEFGDPRVYKVRFVDGFEWDVFEDELMDSQEEFFRPNPPNKISEARKIVRNTLREFFNLNEQEDIIEISIDDLILSKKSVIGAFKNFIDGRSSKSTDMPIEIWKTENGENLVVDGNHRVVEGILKGVRRFNAIIVGEGWSDYWVNPSRENKFIPNSKQKYGGLESVISSSLLSHHQI